MAIKNATISILKAFGQDEARIKCKSTDMYIRYFLFLFEQMLQTIWICFYKDEISFKEFLIEMNKVSKRYTNTQE